MHANGLYHAKISHNWVENVPQIWCKFFNQEAGTSTKKKITVTGESMDTFLGKVGIEAKLKFCINVTIIN